MFVGKLKCWVGLVLPLAFACTAQASISLSATRIVFEEKSKEASVTVRNSSGQDMLLQSWIEADEGDKTQTPFVVTPPLAKLGVDGRQVLRVLYRGSGMPTDKESVVWLNAQEIPQAAKQENTLQLAVRQRIKLFYRPIGLPGTAAEAPGLLQWRLVKSAGGVVLEVKNPSVYHVSMFSVVLGKDGKGEEIEGEMVKPGQIMRMPLKKSIASSETKLTFQSVSDWGASMEYQGVVNFQEFKTGTLKQ